MEEAMRKFSTILVICILGLFTMAQAQAQRGFGEGNPGIQKIIIDYGERLNLTDEQKNELIANSLEQRSNMQRQHMRRGQQQSAWRGNNRGGGSRQQGVQRQKRVERGDQGNRSGRATQRGERSNVLQDVLTEDQLAILREIRTENIEKQHEFRMIRNQAVVEKAGIDEDKTARVIEILNFRDEIMKNMQIQRVENPGSQNRESMRESAQRIRDSQNELKNLLTAAEYEGLQRAQRPARQARATMRRGR
jgi:hypothetical protein